MFESQSNNVPICFIVQLVEHCKGNDVRKLRRECSDLLHRSLVEHCKGNDV